MNASSYQAKLATPFGVLGIRTAGDALAEIVFLPPGHRPLEPTERVAENTCDQINQYLEDPAFRFDLPLRACGTAFQRRVWARIRRIETGQTRTYAELAADLESAPRAVGQACGANRFPLVIACHRVVSSAGLGGFAHREGGYLLSIKRWLLRHEHALAP